MKAIASYKFWLGIFLCACTMRKWTRIILLNVLTSCSKMHSLIFYYMRDHRIQYRCIPTSLYMYVWASAYRLICILGNQSILISNLISLSIDCVLLFSLVALGLSDRENWALLVLVPVPSLLCFVVQFGQLYWMYDWRHATSRTRPYTSCIFHAWEISWGATWSHLFPVWCDATMLIFNN